MMLRKFFSDGIKIAKTNRVQKYINFFSDMTPRTGLTAQKYIHFFDDIGVTRQPQKDVAKVLRKGLFFSGMTVTSIVVGKGISQSKSSDAEILTYTKSN